jgi:Carboxypeptidase regulatory-like domain
MLPYPWRVMSQIEQSGLPQFAQTARVARRRRCLLLYVITASVLLSRIVAAQGLTGALIGSVKDAQGGVLPGAVVRVSSPALIGGPATVTTNDKGQLRFPTLPPGPYALDIVLQGFATYHGNPPQLLKSRRSVSVSGTVNACPCADDRIAVSITAATATACSGGTDCWRHH